MTARMPLAVAIVLAGALVGCAVASAPPADGSPAVAADAGLALHVRNETDREVEVIVDGAEVVRVAAGTRRSGQTVIVPARQAYSIEARTSAGRVLGSFTTAETAEFGAPVSSRTWIAATSGSGSDMTCRWRRLHPSRRSFRSRATDVRRLRGEPALVQRTSQVEYGAAEVDVVALWRWIARRLRR
jgi:hypothetical protein